MLRTMAAAIGVESRTALAPTRPSLGLVVDNSNNALSLERQRMVHSKDVPSPYPILSPCQGEELETVPFCLKSCACNVWNPIQYDYMSDCMSDCSEDLSNCTKSTNLSAIQCQIAHKITYSCVRLHIRLHILVSDCT